MSVLLCGAVSSALEKALTAAGIQVLGFLGGEMESIVAAFIDGHLNDGRASRADGNGRQPRSGERRDAWSSFLGRLEAMDDAARP